MKILKIVLILLCTIHFKGQTQIIADSIKLGDSVNVAYEARMNEIFENVDFSYVPSGRLYERGLPFVTLEPFNGQITDSSKSNIIIFSLAYASIVSMTVDSTTALPDPSSYRNIMDKTDLNSTKISVAGMHQKYNTIDTNAFYTDLLTLVDEKYEDVLPRASSPYLDKELFMFAPAEYILNNPVFSLYFDSTLFYNNSGKIVDSLFIDMGFGFQLISFNQEIQLAYSEAGRKEVKIKLKYTDGSSYYSNFDLIIKGSAFRTPEGEPDIAEYIPGYVLADEEFNEIPSSGQGGGWIYTYLACGHERIEKPFIWAEAFNPAIGSISANLTKEDIIERLKHEDGWVDDQNLYDYLQENGYDIIILDYDHGADYLMRTSYFIEQAILWVNTQKHAAGSNAKNVILGQSMGGVATMEALRRMETSDTPHECEKFIVFDSPLNGVNIPLAAQASLLDMATLWVNKPLSFDDRFLFEYVEVIEDIVRLLYLPATRTMITEQCNDINISGTGAEIPLMLSGLITLTPGTDEDGFIQIQHLYNEFYEELHSPGAGMPLECEVLVLANGSVKGADGQQDFIPGQLLVSPKINNMTVGSLIAGYLDDAIGDEDLSIFSTDIMSGSIGLLLWQVGVIVNIDIKMWAMKHETNFKYYKNSSYVKLPILPAIVYHHNSAKTSNGKEYDHVSGGFFGLGNQAVYFAPGGSADNALETFNMHTWCFTPTGSVLNYHALDGNTWIDEPIRNYNDRYAYLSNNTTQGVSSYIANYETVKYDADLFTDYNNTAHTWFTETISEYLIYHLLGSNELEGIDLIDFGTTFNYGQVDLTPECLMYEYDIPVRTSTFLDHSILVNETEFNVNANDMIGLSPSPYAPVVLGDAAANSHFVMHLGPMCEPTPKVNLQLGAGGIMNIGDGETRTGSVLVQDGHQITVKAGGILKIKVGSTLKLNPGGLLYIEDGGKVIIEGNLVTETGSEMHYFEGGIVELNGENSQLVIGGFLHLHENADFKPTHTGVNSGVIVITNQEGALIAETGSKFRVIGDTDTDPLLVIQEMAKLIAPEELEEFFIGSCNVIIRSAVDFPIQSFTKFTSSNVAYIVGAAWEIGEIHPKIGLFSKGYISSSSFEDVLIYAEEMIPTDGYLLVVNNSTFNHTFKNEDHLIEMANGNVSINNCEFDNYTAQGLFLNGLTSFSSILNSEFTSVNLSNGIAVHKIGENELLLKNNNFTFGKTGAYNSQGQLSLRCNNFSNIEDMGVFGGYNARIEMSQNFKQGYNSFDNIDGNSVKLQQGNFLSISNGYNYFWDNSSTSIIEGTLNLDLPGALVLPGGRNQWNASNAAPTASDIEVYTYGTTDEIPYYTSPTMSGTCGAYDPSSPPIIAVDSQSGIYLPQVNLPGFAGMRLDAALALAVANTKMWDATKNDAQAIGYFHAILTKNYTSQELARPETRYFLDQTYAAMKYTLGHAMADSTLLKANNISSFDATVQKYVDVLNLLTQEDTFSLADYHKRFALELDKANLFRMLGHTETGLDILQNISLCPIDSSERVALNELMAIYENETLKRAIGASAYGVDNIYVNVANYTTPSESQATEFNFGSVINTLSNVSYRTCNSGSLMPDDDSNRATSFLLYPNPSAGVINLKYEIPSESNAELIVYSMNGQVIYRGSLVDGSNTEMIDISKVESGLYFYTVLYNGVFEHAGRISITH